MQRGADGNNVVRNLITVTRESPGIRPAFGRFSKRGDFLSLKMMESYPGIENYGVIGDLFLLTVARFSG
jgi:hypothetical protein